MQKTNVYHIHFNCDMFKGNKLFRRNFTKSSLVTVTQLLSIKIVRLKAPKKSQYNTTPPLFSFWTANPSPPLPLHCQPLPSSATEVTINQSFSLFTWTVQPNEHALTSTFCHIVSVMETEYKYKASRIITFGGGDSSVVRAPDSWLKGRGFESLLERRENFLLQGRLSVLTLISVSVPPPCYHSST